MAGTSTWMRSLHFSVIQIEATNRGPKQNAEAPDEGAPAKGGTFLQASWKTVQTL